MNFDFSDDQKALADEVGKVLRKEGGVALARACLEEGSAGCASLWRMAGELGWCGVAIPEAYGGLGMTHFELCLIAEQLGRVLAPIPFSSSIYLAAEALLLAGSESQKERLLPALAAGEIVCAVAPFAADVQFDGEILNGSVAPLVDGLQADWALLLAGETLLLVDLTQDGVARSGLRDLDPTRPSAQVSFAQVPAEALGTVGQGRAVLGQLLDRAATLIAFEQMGIADACLERAVEYAKQRYAFGRPVGSFQAVKHKLADLFVLNQLARSNAYYAAWALATDAPALPEAAASARVSAGVASQQAAQEAIQVHGGIGFTWELDCHLFYRRAKHLNLMLGSLNEWKLRLSHAVERKIAA